MWVKSTTLHPISCKLILMVEWRCADLSLSETYNCPACSRVINRERNVRWHAHARTVKMPGWKCVVACRSTVGFSDCFGICHFLCFSLSHWYFPPAVVSLYLHCPSHLFFLFILSSFWDTCHYLVLKATNASPRLSVTAGVCMWVIKQTACV